MLELLVAAVLWFASGAFSFVYWWTSQRDLTTNEIESIVFSSVLGPIAWFPCKGVFGPHDEPKVLFKKRT